MAIIIVILIFSNWFLGLKFPTKTTNVFFFMDSEIIGEMLFKGQFDIIIKSYLYLDVTEGKIHNEIS